MARRGQRRRDLRAILVGLAVGVGLASAGCPDPAVAGGDLPMEVDVPEEVDAPADAVAYPDVPGDPGVPDPGPDLPLPEDAAAELADPELPSPPDVPDAPAPPDSLPDTPGADLPDPGGEDPGAPPDIPLADQQAPPDTMSDAGPVEKDPGSGGGGDLGEPDTYCPEGTPCEHQYMGPCDEAFCDAEGDCVKQWIEGCCYNDSYCDPDPTLGPCTELRCISYACTPTPVPGCCADAASACQDELACTIDMCLDDLGRCTRCPQGCDCPANPVLYQQGFDADTINQTGFYAVDYQQTDEVRWQVDDHRWVRPPTSLYLGDPVCRTYYSGALTADCQPQFEGIDSGPVRTILYGPTANLTAAMPGSGAGKVALFWLWADVEPPLGLGPDEPDVLKVAVQKLGSPTLTWPNASSLSVGKTTAGQWRLMAVDLAPYEGSTVRLAIEFDTLDGQLNHFEGLYIDDYQVVDKCAGGCCEVDDDCAAMVDDDPCLAPRCVVLSDGTGGVCAMVAANPGEPCVACASDAECDDGNPCTEDLCEPDGGCSHAAFCCFQAIVLADDFEAGLDAWYVEDDQPEDGVGWQVSAAESLDGGAAAWFGDPATGTYASGGAVRGAIRSETFTLPNVQGAYDWPRVSFWLHLTTEWQEGQVYDNPGGIDRLSAELLIGPQTFEIWSSDELSGTTAGQWLPIELDLPLDLAGKPAQLRFVFDSLDDSLNDFAGPFIDEVKVMRHCSLPGS